MMKLEMISTGEEVLSGQIIDTNAAWFSNTMMDLGIELQRRHTVGDRMEDLVSIFEERSRHADLILVNGGLGPTTDDLSAAAAAKALNEPLVEDAGWRVHLEEWFTRRGRTMPASNLKQCLLPTSATLVHNPTGSAPGFRFKLNNAWLFFTPGVPSEFKPMVEESLIPFMQETFGLGEKTALKRLLTLGHGESSIADKLDKLPCPAGITLGYRPSMPCVEIKLFARGDSALAALPDFTERVKHTLETAVVAEDQDTIATALHEQLLASGRTLALAESCTGGMLTSLLVDQAGSSHYLMQGLVTYSNAAKVNVLGVPKAVLESQGAVSMDTARAMAEGTRRIADSDLALSTTGIAGPDGGTEEKPVGTVCIALANREQTWVQTVRLGQRSRTLVRELSCAIALDMLRRHLLNEHPVVDYPFITRVEQSP